MVFCAWVLCDREHTEALAHCVGVNDAIRCSQQLARRFPSIRLEMRLLTADDEGFSIAVTFAAIFNALLGSALLLVAYLASLALVTFVYVVIGAEILLVLIFAAFGHRQDK